MKCDNWEKVLQERFDLEQVEYEAKRALREENVKCCDEAKIMPLICIGRERHHRSWKDWFAEPSPFPQNPAPLQAMAHRLATSEGKQCYALRKQIPEPVFGIIKPVMGFRQFSLRGLQQVKGEWNLVTLASNVRCMFVLTLA